MNMFDSFDYFPRRRNGPPPIDLLPSERAAMDAQEGADLLSRVSGPLTDAPMLGSSGRDMDNAPGLSPRKRFDTRGFLVNALGGVSDYMRGLRNGGEVYDGETVRVGEDGEEEVTKLPDGRVLVIPKGDLTPALGNSGRDTTGEAYGLGQTESDLQPPPPGRTPSFDNFGWNSDTPEMKAQRQYDYDRPATLDETRNEYNQVLQNIKPSPWKDFGAALVQGFDNWANHKNDPIRSYGEIKAERKLRSIAPRLQALEAEDKANLDRAYKQSMIDWNLKRPDVEYAKIEQRRQAAEGVSRRVAMNIDFRKGVAKPYIDERGMVWKQFLNDPSRPMEPLENPVTHEQEFVPGEQGIQWETPSGETVVIKARQSVMPEATIAAGNANRETDVNKFNATKAQDAVKENINNVIQYNGQVANLLKDAITADGAVDDGAVQGINAEFEATNAELQRLQNNPPNEADPDTQDKAMAAHTKRINELVDKTYELANKQWAAVGKTDAGRAKAAELKALADKLPRPAKITYEPIKATKVQGGVTGRPVPKSKDPLGIFQ